MPCAHLPLPLQDATLRVRGHARVFAVGDVAVSSQGYTQDASMASTSGLPATAQVRSGRRPGLHGAAAAAQPGSHGAAEEATMHACACLQQLIVGGVQTKGGVHHALHCQASAGAHTWRPLQPHLQQSNHPSNQGLNVHP